MHRMFRTFLDAQHGSVTMEFMVALPLLVGWLVGSFVMFDMFWSYSLSEKATYVVGALVSRRNAVSDAMFDEYYLVYAEMTPRAAGERVVRIISIGFEDGAYVLGWSHVEDADGQPGPGGVVPLSDATLPIDILPTLAPFDTVVLVETFTPFNPIAEWFGLAPFTILNQITLRPRFVREISDNPPPATGT